MYKPLTAKNFNKAWLKTVSYTEFKKNPIIATFSEKEQDRMFIEFTGKKLKPKTKGA